MKRNEILLLVLSVLSAILLSLPWLIPHTGAIALVAFVPLLCADALAAQLGKRFWPYALLCFVLWNAATTFWVCEASVGGGIIAVIGNAIQMLLIWMLFRLSVKIFKSGVLPYIFLAAMWLAWERRYFDVEISWPWLTLGNAFADSTRTVQWYEFTGTLGGSLWVWVCNLGFFATIAVLLDGVWTKWNKVARISAIAAMTLVLAGPVILSKCMYESYAEKSEGTIDVLIAQPNFDPYQKFESLPQAEQNERLLAIYNDALAARTDTLKPLLLLAPETFTGGILLNNIQSSATIQEFSSFLRDKPYAKMIMGASCYEYSATRTAPSMLARQYGDGWMRSYNSALLLDTTVLGIHHKSKLVVGSEKTPYPKIFVPLDNSLSKKMGVGSIMGRCEEAADVTVLNFDANTPIGCAVCYESIYGEYCTKYVRKGAKILTVITNDAWWGDTPGYRQHLNYSRLRAIETRRDIARCANTGISCFIDQRGEILSQSEWWKEASLESTLNLSSKQTAFVKYGDIVGRVASFIFLLLAALAIVRAILPKK